MRRWELATGLVAAGVTAVVLAGVVVAAGRVGSAARFVTWPIVGFTAIAAVTAIVGAWSGSSVSGDGMTMVGAAG